MRWRASLPLSESFTLRAELLCFKKHADWVAVRASRPLLADTLLLRYVTLSWAQGAQGWGRPGATPPTPLCSDVPGGLWGSIGWPHGCQEKPGLVLQCMLVCEDRGECRARVLRQVRWPHGGVPRHWARGSCCAHRMVGPPVTELPFQFSPQWVKHQAEL